MKNLNNQLYILIQLFIYFISKIYSIEIHIKNNESAMKNLSNTINDRQTQEELKLIFNEDYYNIAAMANNDFSIQKNIIFYSENGTIFNFQHSCYSHFTLNLKPDSSIKFYNITFFDFFDEIYTTSLNLYYIPLNNNNFRIEYHNCKFIQNKGLLLNFIYKSTKKTQTTPQVIFNNCSFK